MIISFKIENFRSIKEEISIDLTAEKRLKEPDLTNNSFKHSDKELLRSMLLYGRNASGKSNILNALHSLKYLIDSSDKFKHGDILKCYEPFLFDTEFNTKPVRFEIDFITNGEKNKFKYIVSFNETKILFEALYVYPSGTRAKLYERNDKKITYGEYYKGVKKKIEDDLLPNQLFLSKSASSNIAFLNDCALYFRRYVYVSTIHDTEYDKAIIRAFAELIKDGDKLKYNLLELLKAADTSISDIDIVENEKEINFPKTFPKDLRKKYLNDNKYEVKTSHSLFEKGKEIRKIKLGIEKESFGTKKLFAIGSLILATLDDGGVIVIDELDKGLHPLLSKLLIKLFHSKSNNPNNAQLIFATHDSTLLDLEVLRRDQVYFIDKEYEENSISYRLSDIKGIRKDTPIDKWYLSGRFNAIPITTEPKLIF